MNYPEIAIEKATNFLENLEVFTKQYHPGGEVKSYHKHKVSRNLQQVDLHRYWIKYTLCDGDDSLGFLVKIDLDVEGILATNPELKSWTKRDYTGH